MSVSGNDSLDADPFGEKPEGPGEIVGHSQGGLTGGFAYTLYMGRHLYCFLLDDAI